MSAKAGPVAAEKPTSKRQRDRRKADQHADHQRDQRDREGREPAGMHRREADDQLVHQAANAA